MPHNPGNPFMKLQHQNSYPQQNYPPPQHGFFGGQQNFGQQQQPQQQQPRGMFGNFIMDQLSGNMNGSQSSSNSYSHNPYGRNF